MTDIRTRYPDPPRRILSRLAQLLVGPGSLRNRRPAHDRPAVTMRERGSEPRTMILPAIPMFHSDGRRPTLSDDACTDLWIRSLR